MCIRILGLVLLLCFPGDLRAQSVARSCDAPVLGGGFFAPRERIYSHGAKLNYTCSNGRKPADQGWLATSTCDNGRWSPQPQCIDGNACIPPNIPNGKYSQSSTGWFPDTRKIQITCDEGYETKNNELTAQCVNGAWTSLPVCEIREDSCSEPPQLPHAVIVNQKNQEVFAADSVVIYQCEDGFTTEQGHRIKSVICLHGNWTVGPTCRSSTGSGSSEATVQTVPVSNCGKRPIVQNADVVQSDEMFLKYRCNDYYSLVGPETVKCYSNGLWSERPTCTDAYCVLNTEGHDKLKDVGRKYIRNGDKLRFECKKLKFYWVATHYAEVQCTNGQLEVGNCCSKAERFLTSCD